MSEPFLKHSGELYRELQSLITGLPDHATKCVIEMEAGGVPVVTVTQLTYSDAGQQPTTKFRLVPIDE